MWIDNISEIMYEKCLKTDKKEYWLLITEDCYLYHYCKNVKDRPEMYNRISNSFSLYMYCLHIKNRKELSDKIINKFYKNKINLIKEN